MARGEGLPVRVLSLGTGSSVSDLSRALAGAGYTVEVHDHPPGTESEPALGGFDAVILDLTPEGLSDAILSEFAAQLDRLAGTQDTSAPLVLGITGDGKAPAGRSVAADIFIGTQRPDEAALQVETAIAHRRLKEAEEEIARLKRTILDARKIAHDLAQPLTTVLARSQLLLRKLDKDDPNYRPLSIISQEAARLAALVERFQMLKETVPSALPGD